MNRHSRRASGVRGPPVSHAFLIHPQSGIVHLVSARDARSACKPTDRPPLDWLIPLDASKPLRTCESCLKIAYALRARGALHNVGLDLKPQDPEQIDPHDLPHGKKPLL